MPTKTFYHLPEEKRARLNEAIFQELARVPFDKISINRIVKEAGISRGSYYQYFTSTNDLYGFVIDDYRKTMISALKHALLTAKGDIFLAIETMLAHEPGVFYQEENLTLFRHLFTEIRDRELIHSHCCRTNMKEDLVTAILPAVNLSLLRVETEDEATELIQLVLSLAAGAILQLINGTEPDRVKQGLERNMRWLQYGMRREENVR